MRVVSTILALLLFTLETIHSSEPTITRVEETTYRVAQALFAWNTDMDVEETIRVEAMELDETTFAPDSLLTVVLDLGGAERRVALLLASSNEWEDVYSRRLETLLRANGLLLVTEHPETTLTDVLPSGYWMRNSPHDYGAGTEFLVASDTPLARLVVHDSFEFEGDVVTEFVPLWSARDLVAGMPLEEKRTLRTKLSLPFSLQRYGISLEADLAIPRSMFRIAILGELQKEFSGDAYEITGGLGVRRPLSIGMFAPPESLGRWWTNMFIVPNMQLHIGIRMENGSLALLHGAEVGLQIGYQVGVHCSFGVQISYRYRAMMDSGVSTSVQSNENGIVLSPSMGWMW